MVSSHKAGFNLRETFPLPRNILHACEVVAHESTRQRMNPLCKGISQGITYTDCLARPISRVESGNLSYPASIRDSAKSGLGCCDNRHLLYLAESIFVNVGGSLKDAKLSSPTMPCVSVGATIVVRDWESQSQGEGSQSVGISSANVTEC